MDVLAQNLRDRSRKLELAHAEVARRAGLSEQRFGNYIAGIREPDLATLVRIAEALGTTPNELLGVGTQNQSESGRERQLARLRAAADQLTDSDLEVLIQLTEKAVDLRRETADPK